jgi:hypothetical protein
MSNIKMFPYGHASRLAVRAKLRLRAPSLNNDSLNRDHLNNDSLNIYSLNIVLDSIQPMWGLVCR